MSKELLYFQFQSPFFSRFPQEIRTDIYERVLFFKYHFHPGWHRMNGNECPQYLILEAGAAAACEMHDLPLEPNQMGLLKTCKRIYDEAHHHLYRNNTFVFAPNHYPDLLGSIPNFLPYNSLGDFRQQAISHLNSQRKAAPLGALVLALGSNIDQSAAYFNINHTTFMLQCAAISPDHKFPIVVENLHLVVLEFNWETANSHEMLMQTLEYMRVFKKCTFTHKHPEVQYNYWNVACSQLPTMEMIKRNLVAAAERMPHPYNVSRSCLRVNAPEFVPGRPYHDYRM